MATSEPGSTPTARSSAAPGTRPQPAQNADSRQATEVDGAADAVVRPPAVRIAESAMLGGVCAGLSRHLGWPVIVLRVGFVILMCLQFVGVVIYGLLWLLLPPEPIRAAPGLESASRTGLRAAARVVPKYDWGSMFALIALGVGLLSMIQISGLGLSQLLFWPILLACAGVALVWRQADLSRQRNARAELSPRTRSTAAVARSRTLTVLSLIFGLTLVLGGFTLILAQQGSVELLPNTLAMSMLVLAALAIVLAPWLHRSRAELNEARSERVRAETRADMAAHLHDSVLQTLALIQRQAEDPKTVQRLARRQERELRGWLYDEEPEPTTFRASLATAAAEVEDEHGVPVELVAVGDSPPGMSVQAIVAATREAMVNAAKHSGADKIDVYAEVGAEIEVYVRDRGQGFQLDRVSADRMGVRGSIIERMRRHGGTAHVRSGAGNGTEVRLSIEPD